MWKPEYCQALIDHASEGFTFESFAGKIGVGIQTLYNWLESHDDFLEAREKALAISRLALERYALDVFRGITPAKEFPTALWIIWMKNCHGWRDKVELDASVNTLHSKMLDDIAEAEVIETSDVKKLP